MRREDKFLHIEGTRIYQYYYNRLMSVALAQFEWNNLPETCDRLYFEKTLLTQGRGALYIPKGSDFWLSTGFLQRDKWDVYGYPTAITGIGYNATNIETDEFIVCWDNVMKDNLLVFIDLYAKLLYEVHQTFRSNLRHQNTPYIVQADKNILLSLRNMFLRIFSFDPVIEVKKTFDKDAISTIETKVDFKGVEILDSLKVIWAEALSMLGITAQTTKKERMLADELTVNRMSDMMALNSRLMPRIDFCNRINDRYGLDLSVNLSTQDLKFQPYQDPAMRELGSNTHDGYDSAAGEGDE